MPAGPLMAAAVTEAMAVWAPPPKLTVSEWADRFRVLSAEAAAEPGQWRTDRAEYQRGIMDAVSDTAVETVVVMKSAQVGWTEIINNCVGFHVHQDPAPILIVQPTVEMGQAWSKDRLAPMLRDSPALKGRVAEPRSRDGDNTLLHKTYPGGQLTIAGANSAASLASRPIRVVLFDEVDRYPASAGSEGDPITLGRKRTATFWNRKVLIGSTPTIKGISRIEAAYEQSDQRRYWVSCPHCDDRQTLRWQHVKWPAGRPMDALYHCESCGAGWTDGERWQAIRRGEWRAEAPFTGTAGFHINELYSTWRRLSETVADFLAAKDRPEMLKAWVNTALGETWQERGDAPEADRLIERRETWPAGTAPRGVLIVTAGIDMQGDRLEVYVWGWGRGLESWLLAREVIEGDPSQPETWDAMLAVLDRDIPHESGAMLRVSRAAADTGGTGTMTQSAYANLRRLRDHRLLPIKGQDRWGGAAMVTGPTKVDVTERGVKSKNGLRLWTISASSVKAEIYRRLWIKRGDAEGYPTGWVHLPIWLEGEPVRQLVAEQLVTVKDRRGFSRQEWQKLRERNEALDCTVYARAALYVLGADRRGERFWAEAEAALDAQRQATATDMEIDAPEQPPVAPPPPTAPARSGGWLAPRGGGWLRR